jgi:hypothetical protein
MSAVQSLSEGKRTCRGQPNLVENDPARDMTPLPEVENAISRRGTGVVF